MATDPSQAFDDYINKACYTAERLINVQLRKQVPVDTGALRKSIRVKVEYDGKTIKFRLGYLDYGVFTDLGTGPYLTAENARGPWNATLTLTKSPKGKGGIEPRFWTSIDPKDIRKFTQDIKVTTKRYIKAVIGRINLTTT